MFNRMFEFQKKEVRMVIKDNQPWFVAKDVCEVLEIVRHHQAAESLKLDERGTYSIGTPSGFQKMVCVNESGLYHLIFKSRKKVAEDFRYWVTSEVLPSIRKHGFWMNTKPTDEDMRNFIERFFPDSHYGVTSDKTGLKRLIPVKPYFRSCKIARANCDSQQDLFLKEQS